MASLVTESLLIEMVEAVIAVEKTWKPKAYRDDVTFFSSQDIWTFIPSWQNTCEDCAEFATGIPILTGDQIRGMFPYLAIVDEDTIDANVHPNCRCQLVRFSEFSSTEV